MFKGMMEIVSKRPILGAITLGAVVSIATLIAGLFMQYFLHLMLPESWWGISAATEAFNQPAAVVFFFAVVFAPLYETILAQLLPIEIVRRFAINRWGCVFISATVFGVGHYLNGGLLHGLVTFTVGILFAILYMLLRSNGAASSFVGVATAHALHNAILLYVLATLFPSLA